MNSRRNEKKYAEQNETESAPSHNIFQFYMPMSARTEATVVVSCVDFSIRAALSPSDRENFLTTSQNQPDDTDSIFCPRLSAVHREQVNINL